MKLSDPSLFIQAALVADRVMPVGGDAIVVINPATGQALGTVPSVTTESVREAIAAAERGRREWAARTADERSRLLRDWFDLVMANQDDLAMILTLEQGKPLTEAKGEIAYGASFIAWFAEEARRINGDILPGNGVNNRIMVLRQPVGVVAAITPWNFPNAMVTRKVAPALAAGCAVILKPASQTPYSALALAELARRAGIPAALFSVVTGSAKAIGAELTSNPFVRKISFTGSTEIGAVLMAQSAPTLKKLSLELGGNAPLIIFDDADVDAAVEGTLIAKFRNNGQTCVCANRILVQDGVHDAYVAKLKVAMTKLTVGNGLDAGTALGPLIDQAALRKMEDHVSDAVAKGGRLELGGRAHAMGGTYFEPTLITGATGAMAVGSEETFGPLAAIFRFSTDDEAIALANATEFGLAAYFYTRDLSRQWRVVEALEVGMVGVNTGFISTATAPFGGIKQSGIGREGSKYGLDDYTELKYVNVMI
jgi:succinate-semialdehyde dehydrogenase/glutarate-semialdehyde dehydrogenase